MDVRDDGLLADVRARGRDASVPEDAGGRVPDADALVRLVRLAASLPRGADARVLAAWDEAGALHDPAAIDAALAQLTTGRWIPVVGGMRAHRLRDSARTALGSTRRAGTVQLACAVLGAVGDDADIEALEALARHPAFTLHAATALSNLASWKARAALLRLLASTDGAERVLVIDRLLPHVREPAVRLALVRDALRGLAPEHAREVAADIAALCDVRSCVDDPSAPEEVRAGARLVLAACPPAQDP